MPESNFEYARVIGEKLRTARQQRQMSLRDLAKKADISASMLSQIETGKAYPSVRSIYSIAEALGLPVDHFFPDQIETPQPGVIGDMTASEMREATMNGIATIAIPEFTQAVSVMAQVIHANARPTILLKGGVTWSRLTANAEPGVEFLEIRYASGATSGENLSHHDGREFGFVLEGELVVELDGRQITLQVGDSIVFDSTTPHRLVNQSAQPMRALWVVWNPAP